LSLASLIVELFENYFFLSGKEFLQFSYPQQVRFGILWLCKKTALRSPECQQYWMQKLSDYQMMPLPRSLSSQPSASTSEVSQLEVPISSEVYRGLERCVESLGVP
jgi:hypothetical protein